MKIITPACRSVCLLILLLVVLQSVTIANEIDFSELDKLVPAELIEKNTPGAVIAIVSGDRVVYQKLKNSGFPQASRIN